MQYYDQRLDLYELSAARLVTQKLLDVAQGVAREELENEEWLRLMAQLSNRSYEQVRVAVIRRD